MFIRAEFETVVSPPLAVVLGAAGFVGRHVARSLAGRGCRVLGIGHGNWTGDEWTQWGISKWLEADISLDGLNQLVKAEPPQCIVHCGGSGAVSYSYSNPLSDFQRATQSTAVALEWARIFGGGRCRVVLVSSAAVYGDQGESDTTENSIRSPISPYGVHKAAAEALCESYSRFFMVPSSIVRLFSVYGEGLRKQLLWDAMNKFRKGDSQFFGTGHELRDWLHIDDAAELLTLAALSPQSRLEVYNGARDQATTSQVLHQLAALSYTDRVPRFSGEAHLGNPRRLTADCSHASRLLSWTPRVTLIDGLRRYAQWFIHDET